MSAVLVGAGGHAQAVFTALLGCGARIDAYVDPKPCSWLDARRLEDGDEVPASSAVVIGIGGMRPDKLSDRLALLDSYLARGLDAPPVVHPAATVDRAAVLEAGVVVLAGAVVQPGVSIGRGSIVNSGAIVEHDSKIGAGVHVAPGAIVLGRCRVGDVAMIGAGAVVLPASTVPDGTLVRAATRYPS